MSTPPPSLRTALVLGHPGHELRILGWAAAHRPCVAVLTDGSGHDGVSRIGLTTDILAQMQCRTGSIYGDFTDRDIYARLLAHDVDFFLDLAERLSAWLQAERIDVVASDSIEGYNPTHDICAALVVRAVRLASAACGRHIRHYAFALTDAPSPEPAPLDALLTELDADALDAKLTLSRQYARQAGGALVDEVEDMISRFGRQAFATEILVPADEAREFAPFTATPPFYETHGERQVAAGRYRDVIRFRQHMVPVILALRA